MLNRALSALLILCACAFAQEIPTIGDLKFGGNPWPGFYLRKTASNTLSYTAGACPASNVAPPAVIAAGTIVATGGSGGGFLYCKGGELVWGNRPTQTVTCGGCGTIEGPMTAFPVGEGIVPLWEYGSAVTTVWDATGVSPQGGDRRSPWMSPPPCVSTATVTCTVNSDGGYEYEAAASGGTTLFGYHLINTTSAGLTGSFADIATATIPALPAGKCFRFHAIFNKVSGTNTHTTRWEVGGVSTSTIAATSNANTWRVIQGTFCNAAGTQTTNQLLIDYQFQNTAVVDASTINSSTNPVATTINTASPFTFKLQARNDTGSGDTIHIKTLNVWELP